MLRANNARLVSPSIRLRSADRFPKSLFFPARSQTIGTRKEKRSMPKPTTAQGVFTHVEIQPVRLHLGLYAPLCVLLVLSYGFVG